MKLRQHTTLFIALTALATTSAHAGAYNFGGNCPSQGAWTQEALQQTDLIKNAILKLKDNPACKGLETVLTDLQSAAATLDTPVDQQNTQTRMESLPTEMGALQKTITADGKINSEASSMLLNRTIEAASISSKISQNSTPLTAPGGGIVDAATASSTGGLSLLFQKLKAPAQKGLDLATKVMQILPQYDECLIGQPSQGLAIISGSVKVAAALSASGEGVGDKLGNAIASLMNMLRERKFTKALRELDETEFWFSMSCLVESSTKNYCDAQNAQEIMRYSQDQYKASMDKIKKADRASPSYDNPLEGYYLLVRELPMISSWLQKVQFGVSPKLGADAQFKNKIWDQVTDLTKSINSLTGYFNEQMLFMRELTDVGAKRNQLFTIINAITSKMSGAGAEAGTADGTQFFATTINEQLLPFYLIGRDTIPDQCRVTETRQIAQDFGTWMKTSGPNGTFAPDFADPDKLATIVEARMNQIVAAAASKASAYFRTRLVVDMPNLVSQTLTSQYMTTRKAFENVYNYLVRFENKLNKNDMDVILIPSVRQTKVKIQKFLKSYNKLYTLGKQMATTASSIDDVTLDPQVNDAAKHVIDTVYEEFNVLLQKDTYLTNRLTTFIEKDFAMRIKSGLNMTPYQQDLLVMNQKNLLQMLMDVHGLNPTRAQQDLAAAQMVNKRNIETIEEVFGDSLFRMIANVKAVVDGKGDAGFQATIDARMVKDKRAYNSFMNTPAMFIISPGAVLTNWLFSGWFVRQGSPDLYQAPKNNNHIMGRDDKFGSFSRMQGMFCSQTLAFERRGQFYDLCHGTSVKSFYQNKPELDLNYDSFLPSASAASRVRASSDLTGKSICAVNDFSIKNIVQWLRDQDKEVYADDSLE